MANIIRNNVSIIASSATSVAFPGGKEGTVNMAAFYSTDSTGVMELCTFANSSDVIVKMQSPVNQPNTTTFKFSPPQDFQKLWVKTLIAGSGWMYMV